MDIIFAALFAVVTIIAYVAVIQRERITVLGEELEDAEKQMKRQQQDADKLSAMVIQFSKTVPLMVREMDKLERENGVLLKRLSRNAPSMRSGVHGHHRGHGA